MPSKSAKQGRTIHATAHDERLSAIRCTLDSWEYSMDNPDTALPIELHHDDVRNFRYLLNEVEKLRTILNVALALCGDNKEIAKK